MRQGLSCLIVMVLAAGAAHAASFGPGEAGKHIGESATICGIVASVHYAGRSRGQPTFLNLGHAYPNQDMAAVIWGQDRSKFGTPETLAGRRICVSGPITLYRNKPEMILEDASQLTQ